MARKKKITTGKQINFLKERQSVSFVYCPSGESAPNNRTVVILNDILFMEFWVSKANGLETMIIVGAKQIGVISPERLVKSLVSDLIEQDQFAVLVDACGYTKMFVDISIAEYCPVVESINRLCIDFPLYERLKDYYGNKPGNFGMYLLAAPDGALVDSEKTEGVEEEIDVEDMEPPTDTFSAPVEIIEHVVDEEEDFIDDTGWMDPHVGEVLHLIANQYKNQVVINHRRFNMLGSIAYRVTVYGRYMDSDENAPSNMAFACNISSAHIDCYPDPVGGDKRVTIYIVAVQDPIMVSNIIDLIVQSMEHLNVKHIVPSICIMDNPTSTVSVIKPMMKYKCKMVQPIPPSRPRYKLYEINAGR